MMTILCKLLLIEDDLPLASLISQYLRANQCDVMHVSSGEEVNLLFNLNEFDIVICDVMLPDISGFELFKTLNKEIHCPVIFFTALDDDKDQIYGLGLGAVDYIVKPVDPAVLLARIKVHTRLRNQEVSSTLRLNKLVLDSQQKKIYYQGAALPITVQEFDVLYLLAQHHLEIVPREVLFKSIIGRDYDGLDRAVDLVISRLRKKLEELSIDYLVIRSIRGKGYLLSCGE